MAYDYNTPIHTLSVTGKLGTDGARLLIDCEEELHKLGYVCTLQLSIAREPAVALSDSPAVVEAPSNA